MNDFSLSSFGTFSKERHEENKNAIYNDLENMSYTRQLTYNELIDKLHKKYFAGSTNRYTLSSDFWNISDINLILKSVLPNKV